MEILFESARAIAQFLRDQDYTEKRLSQLGLTKLPWNSLARQSVRVSTGDGRLDLMTRVFYLGEAVEASQAEQLIPKKILHDFLASGMLLREGERLQPACMLTHFGDLIVACDSCRRVQTSGSGDLVIGVNSTTRLLARCSMLGARRRVLDLGTGCGPLALLAARSAEYVVGTDINKRALGFAEFNAALNGLSNISFLSGDRFEPVAGKRFDLIMTNPPFFLAPVSGLLYCDNGMELDGFVESLVRAAPRFLERGAVFQMVCEWVEFETESWEQRLRSWFAQSGCDVHIWRGYEFNPEEYAQKRAQEQGQLYPKSGSFANRVSYLTSRHVRSVFGGLISMRRRSGQNWFSVEEMQKRPDGPVGDLLFERFTTLDILNSNDEETLLAARPRLPKDVRLMNEALQRNGAWSIERSYLERVDDLPATLRVDAVIAQFVARFDGKQTLEMLLKKMASEQNVSLDRLIPESLRVIKKLGTSGLVVL